MTQKIHKKEQTWKEAWRPMVAYVYLAICVLDFAAMPIIIEMTNKRTIDRDTIELLAKLDPAAQAAAINKLSLGDRGWEPVTLGAGGLFHLAFGAILTGAALTRGAEKKAKLDNGYVEESVATGDSK